MKAFIVAHDDTLDKMSDIPNRGKLKEAQDGIINSLIVAFRCKDKPNLLLGKATFSVEELSKYEDDGDGEHEEMRVEVVQLGQEKNILPSELLSDPLWRSNAVRLFNLEGRVETIQSGVTQGAKDKADRLVEILSARFKKQRYPGSSRQNLSTRSRQHRRDGFVWQHALELEG